MPGATCDVCFYAEGEKADYEKIDRRKARKTHWCCECGRKIRKGESYEAYSGRWDGRFTTYKTCAECVEIRDKFCCDGMFIFRRLWDGVQEHVFPRFTRGCLDELSLAAKRKLHDRWWHWRFD